VRNCEERSGGAPPPLDLDDGGAGDAAVKVAAAPFPSLHSVTAPAVRREALPKSSEEGARDGRVRERGLDSGLRTLAGLADGHAAGR